jgi:excisionase family DNA binding protein
MDIELLTVAEAAGMLRLQEKTIRKWLLDRRVSYAKLGGAVRIPMSEIDRLIDEGTVNRAGGSD